MNTLTTAEAATYLRISPWTLRRAVNEGAIRGSKYAGKWTFDQSDLDDFRDANANRVKKTNRKRRARRSA